MPLNFYRFAYLAVTGYAGVTALFGLAVMVFAPRLKPGENVLRLRIYGLILVALAAAGALVIFLGEPRLHYYQP